MSLGAFHSHAQRTITARILDSRTQKPIDLAEVVVGESTRKTVSNKLGFFSLELGPTDTIFVLSKVGYGDTRLIVPAANQFKILLNREYGLLPSLNMKHFVPGPSITAVTTPAIISGDSTRDASYSTGGWNIFLNDLATEMAKEEIKLVAGDSAIEVYFTVTADGRIAEVYSSKEDSVVTSQINNVLTKMPAWSPAKQNGIAVPQFLKLPISWEEGSTEIYTIVEVSADPVGGMGAFYRFVMNTMKYPVEARRKGISGKVFVEFVVEKDGSITNVRVVKGIGGGCDEEAVRVVSKAPNWVPGTQRSQPVKQRMILPLTFKLG
jgi:TonB family protein